ncbi:MAG: molybdopterin-dependent oxidoreductase [Acidimicrobiia bacterium]
MSERPPNIGVDVSGLNGYSLSQKQMFLRCNFPVPNVLPEGFDIVMPDRATRKVTAQTFFNYREVEIDMVLECAGNGRTLMSPVPEGVAWGLGGVSPITVGGVRLVDVLGSIPESVVDLVFTGADGYQFSIDREMALSRRPILATHIGGEPLDTQHGAPIRLFVPGHYAMKSVKWLMSIEGTPFPFRGHFVQKYRYYQDTSEAEREPVADIAVRSIISSPVEGDTFTEGGMDVRGSAWSGKGEITAVEVSIDGGESWLPTDLVVREVGGRFAPVRWAVTFDVEPGSVEIIARATDSTGETQPLESRWNVNGYANNVVHRIVVEVS